MLPVLPLSRCAFVSPRSLDAATTDEAWFQPRLSRLGGGDEAIDRVLANKARNRIRYGALVDHFTTHADKHEYKIELAEGVGFEPTDACTSAVFKTAAIDHSATLPQRSSRPSVTGGLAK